MSLNSNIPDKTFPSICIPHARSTVTWMHVKEVFEELFGVGSIERVDVVNRNSAGRGNEFTKIFIHFKEWPDTEMATQFKRNILDDKCMKIVYDEPWYWKCYKNNSQRRSYTRGKKPYVQLDGNLAGEGHTSNEGGPAFEDHVPDTF